MHRRLSTVEEPGFGEQEHAGTGRAEQGAFGMHAPDPIDDLRVTAGRPSTGPEQDRWNNDDVSGRYI